jgi:glycosyltransferase involved in cell wall biosynthesis
VSALRVGIDVLALSGQRTGVGRFCAGLSCALLGRDELELRPFAIARRAAAMTTGPARALGLGLKTWAVPTRVANSLWARADWPPIDWLVGAVDVVHGTNYVVPPARRAGRVVTVHDLTAVRFPEMCAPASLAYPRLVARALAQGAFVHVPSRFVADEVIEYFAVAEDRVHVVPHGIDRPETADKGAQSSDFGAGAKSSRPAPYVLALGALEPRKDLVTLVRAFAEIAPFLDELELVVAGPDAWGAEQFSAAVRASGVSARVVRLGYLGEAERRALLSGARVLAYPSLYEGFGFPPLEAMLAGVPVVATAAGAIPEVVGDAAELVAPRDVAGLAGALTRVLNDEALRARLIAAGRVRAGRYTWAASAAAMSELYQLVARKRPGR